MLSHKKVKWSSVLAMSRLNLTSQYRVLVGYKVSDRHLQIFMQTDQRGNGLCRKAPLNLNDLIWTLFVLGYGLLSHKYVLLKVTYHSNMPKLVL